MLLNEFKNVKTIVFSELPNQEKKKYFNFLLENEINFTRDENGYYVALVKLLNPNYYGKTNDNQVNTNVSAFEKPSPIEDKKRANTMINKKGSNTTGKPEGGNTNRNNSTVESAKKTNFEKSNQFAKTSMQQYNELFNNNYNKFFSTLNPLLGVRGKKLNLYQLKYNIEEIYSVRFIKDTSTLRNQLNKNTKSNEDMDVKDPFPVFVVEFLSNKFVKKPVIDQHALDILISVDHFSKSHSDVQIFSRFLNEDYDSDDLIFFLFVRSCIEKEMKMMFIEKARDEIKIQYHEDRDEIDTELYLNVKVCLKIANTIFGNEEELLLNSFMEKIEKNLTSNQKKGKNLIRASTILEITLEDYHQSRKLYGQGNNNNLNFEKIKHSDEENNETRDRINREIIQNNNEKYKDDNLFDEFEDEANEFNNGSKKGVNNKVDQQRKRNSEPSAKNQADKINSLKNAIFNYIKEKELDIFFEKLMTSYSIYEKDNENIENILSTIKDLVGKKLALLISIIFNKDQQNWFVSLKIKEEDNENMNHYTNLVNLASRMSSFNNLQDVHGSLIETFGQNLLSTPELNSQINKLVLKHFG